MKTIKGRVIFKGDVRGEALVAKTPLSFTYIDTTGTIIDRNHDLYGQNINGKIMVLTALKGSAMQPFSIYQLIKKGIGPRGIIAIEADARLVAAAIYCRIPVIDKLEVNPVEAIKSGDKLRLNADEGTVEVG